MATKGSWISGIASTRSRWYEKMPRTVSATITIVANTGWLIATRVIHMALARVRWGGLDRARAAVASQHGRLPMLQVVELGGDHVVGRLQAREHFHQMRALI